MAHDFASRLCSIFVESDSPSTLHDAAFYYSLLMHRHMYEGCTEVSQQRLGLNPRRKLIKKINTAFLIVEINRRLRLY